MVNRNHDFLKNRHNFLIGLVCSYAVTAFPYREYMTQLVLFVILMLSVYAAKFRLKHYGCYQSVVGIALAIVGVFLLHVRLNTYWMIVVSMLSISMVTLDAIISKSIRWHDLLAFDVDNIIYYVLCTFGIFQIYTQFKP